MVLLCSIHTKPNQIASVLAHSDLFHQISLFLCHPTSIAAWVSWNIINLLKSRSFVMNYVPKEARTRGSFDAAMSLQQHHSIDYTKHLGFVHHNNICWMISDLPWLLMVNDIVKEKTPGAKSRPQEDVYSDHKSDGSSYAIFHTLSQWRKFSGLVLISRFWLKKCHPKSCWLWLDLLKYASFDSICG